MSKEVPSRDEKKEESSDPFASRRKTVPFTKKVPSALQAHTPAQPSNPISTCPHAPQHKPPKWGPFTANRAIILAQANISTYPKTNSLVPSSLATKIPNPNHRNRKLVQTTAPAPISDVHTNPCAPPR